MPKSVRVLLIVGVAAAVPLAVWLYDAARRDTRPPVPAAIAPVAAAPTRPRPASVGISSCAAGACHGGASAGSNTPTAWQSSFTQWTTADPHRLAYAALKTDLATRIMTSLKEPDTDATHAARCLACHTNPASANDPARRAEGMNCDSCHGNPDRWMSPHTAFADKNRTQAYDAVGMPKLFDLGTRAELCAGCHVGAPADPARGLPLRDMNHDMIAAGHPRLNFDFAEYQRRMNPHWFEKDRTAPDPHTPAGPAFEAKAWLVGRVASAEAACALLADRATRADPWPEFAEMNCFACHHEFEPASWRLPAAQRTPPRKPGMAAWQTLWPVTRPDDFTKLGSDANHDVVELIARMERSRSPNPALAATAAAGSAKKLRAVRDSLSRSSEMDAARVARGVFLSMPPERADWVDWDEARQMFHGLAALDRTRREGQPDPILAKFADHLRLPRPPGGAWFDSPRGYTPASGRDLLRECLKSVPVRADVIGK